MLNKKNLALHSASIKSYLRAHFFRRGIREQIDKNLSNLGAITASAIVDRRVVITPNNFF